MSSWIHKREEDTGKISASKIGETHRQMQGVMAHQNRNSRVKKKTQEQVPGWENMDCNGQSAGDSVQTTSENPNHGIGGGKIL